MAASGLRPGQNSAVAMELSTLWAHTLTHLPCHTHNQKGIREKALNIGLKRFNILSIIKYGFIDGFMRLINFHHQMALTLRRPSRFHTMCTLQYHRQPMTSHKFSTKFLTLTLHPTYLFIQFNMCMRCTMVFDLLVGSKSN